MIMPCHVYAIHVIITIIIIIITFLSLILLLIIILCTCIGGVLWPVCVFHSPPYLELNITSRELYLKNNTSVSYMISRVLQNFEKYLTSG